MTAVPFLNVKDFGAIGDGSSDDTAAINAAINQAAQAHQSTTVYFPKGTYRISSTLVITQPVRLIGEGNDVMATQGYSASSGSRIRWHGSPGGTVILFKAINHGGFGMEDITIDSNKLARFGIDLDGCAGGFFKNISSFDAHGSPGGTAAASADLRLHALPSSHGSTVTTMSWATFINIYLASDSGSGACLILDGIAQGNACHCTFINTHINHEKHKHGIVLAGCDNVTMIDTFIYRPFNPTNSNTHTGNGVHVIPRNIQDHVFPIANVFYHLQAGAGGWYQPANIPHSPATIHDYQMDNGQPYPKTNGSPLLYDTNYGDQIGRNKGPFLLNMENGWQHYQQPKHTAQYFRDSDGYVHLRGLIKHSNPNVFPSVAAILPIGFRPRSEEHFVVNSNGALGTCYIKENGEISPLSGSNVFFSLSGISFHAAPIL